MTDIRTVASVHSFTFIHNDYKEDGAELNQRKQKISQPSKQWQKEETSMTVSDS